MVVDGGFEGVGRAGVREQQIGEHVSGERVFPAFVMHHEPSKIRSDKNSRGFFEGFECATMQNWDQRTSVSVFWGSDVVDQYARIGNRSAEAVGQINDALFDLESYDALWSTMECHRKVISCQTGLWASSSGFSNHQKTNLRCRHRCQRCIAESPCQ